MRGDGRVFRRGSIWWVAYYHAGREYRESSKASDRKVAVSLLRQRVGEVTTGLLHVSPARPGRIGAATMQDLFDLVEHNHELNGRRNSKNLTYLKRLRRRFAGYTVQACTSTAVSHYMATMLRSGRKAPTINREIAVLRAALRLGYQHDLVPRLPVIKLLPDYSVRNEFFTRAEMDTLLPYLPEYLQDVVLFGFLTGWRKGEILGLEWANVNRATGVIRLHPEQNKGRTVRVLALQGELTTLINRRWHARKAGSRLATHVFHRAGCPLSNSNVRRHWLIACRQAGLGHRWFHSLRRSAARSMSLQGVPEKVIMSIMGHKTRVMFDRYNIVTEADQRAYAERLFQPQHGQ